MDTQFSMIINDHWNESANVHISVFPEPGEKKKKKKNSSAKISSWIFSWMKSNLSSLKKNGASWNVSAHSSILMMTMADEDDYNEEEEEKTKAALAGRSTLLDIGRHVDLSEVHFRIRGNRTAV